MTDYFDPACLGLLKRHRLDSFDALWHLDLAAVDRANVEGKGWSQVFRLQLDDVGLFVKRQSNYRKRTLSHPCGESMARYEFRQIRRYQELGIPALQAVFFAERTVQGECRTVLVTRALDGWVSLESLLPGWQMLAAPQREQIVAACAGLIARVHAARLKYGCFYPKHLFLRQPAGQPWEACLIDLEKTRRLWFPRWDKERDLEPFLRRVRRWGGDERTRFLAAYLEASRTAGSLQLWEQRLGARAAAKGSGR